MKKLLLTIISLFLLLGCEPEIIEPPCAVNYWGTLTVYNYSQFWFYASIHTGNGFPSPKYEVVKLMPGKSYTWDEVSTGEVYYLVSLDKDYWIYPSYRESLLKCEEMEWLFYDNFIIDEFENRYDLMDFIP